MTRFKYLEVKDAIERNGKVSAEDIGVKCKLEEVQPLADALVAAYVTVVNILEGYVEVEEGNAVAGMVAKKVESGKTIEEATASLSPEEKAAFDGYMQWLNDGENAGKIAIEDEDLEKIMTITTSFKEQIGEIKERVKGKTGAKMAMVKDGVTIAKLAGSTAKGGLMLKGLLSREKLVKKNLLRKMAD